MMVPDNDILLEVKGLKKYFPITKGFLKRTVGYVKAVDGVDFYIREGETLGLVGESGCGKTTTGKVILRAVNPTAGEMFLRHNFLQEAAKDTEHIFVIIAEFTYIANIK